MTTPNPYQTPKAAVGDGIDDSEDIEKVRSGQKMLIYAILLNFVTYGFQGAGRNLITLLVLNGRATKMLREAGYTVGLLGAR
jgi:hypothetical protein